MDFVWILFSVTCVLYALPVATCEENVGRPTTRGGDATVDQGPRTGGDDGRRSSDDDNPEETAGATAAGDGETETRESELELQKFQKLFLEKRRQQYTALQEIFDKYNYEQQFKLVELLFDRMHEILAESRQKLTDIGFEPGMSFPLDTETKDGLSLLLENLAFFGDITLRLPDIAHNFYSKKKELREVVRWGITFAEQSGFLDETHKKLLNLMSQELRLIKRDPDYVNPFKREEVTPEPVTPKKKKERKPKKKGPRVSRAEL